MQIQSNSDTGDRGCEFAASYAQLARLVERHGRTASSLESKDLERRRALTQMLDAMLALSQAIDPHIQLYGRIKTIASISDKMAINDLGVDQVLDIVGVRAITQTSTDCYLLVDRIHSTFTVIEDEYDDYIAAPKPNGYRSLHTTVLSPWGLPVEIQVRTHWMHALCQRGPAAHAQYKKSRVAWMPSLRGSLESRGAA